jgi:hypothetical protein
MLPGRHPRRVTRVLRVAGAVALALTALTCRDAGLGPGLPARTSITIAPSIQRGLEPGGPTFESLRAVRGILAPLDGGTPYQVDALFTNDTATLVFDVVFPGTSQRYSLSLAATDTAGDTLFTSTRDITATPGTSRAVDETLRYVGADTAVAFLGLATSDTMVLADDSIVVTAQGYDAQKNAISPLRVGWTTRDGATLTVESRGPATARIVGGDVERDTWIVARAFNGVADSVRVRAMLRVAAVTLGADTLRLYAGDAVTVSAEVSDATGTMLDRAVEWVSDDPAIATVAEPLVDASLQTQRTGARGSFVKYATVTAVTPGTATIVASSNGKADTAVVVVSQPPIARTLVTPGAWRLVSLGEELQLSATSYTADSTPVNGKYTWSVDPNSLGVVTVDGTGRVAAVTAGTTAVIVTESGGTADTATIVVDQVAAAVYIDPLAAALPVGSTQQFTAKAVDAKGNSIPDATFTWFTTGNQVTHVDSSGLVFFDMVGVDTVFVSIDGLTAGAGLQVVEAVGTVTVTGVQLLDALGSTTVLRAQALDASGKPIPDASFSWSSKDASIVSVVEAAGDSAVVRADGVGTTTVAASSGVVVGSLDISVTDGAVTSQVVVSPESLLFGKGGQGRFTATLLDSNGVEVAVSPTEIVWGVEGTTGIATVDAIGEVTALEPGKTAVYATIREIRSANAAVEVSDTMPMIARFSADTIELGLETITISVYLASAYTAPLMFTLAVADGTASVETSTIVFEAGMTRVDVLLTGVQSGTTTITATDVDKVWTAASAIVIVGDALK